MKKLFTLFFVLMAIATGAKAQDDMAGTPLTFEAIEDETEVTITNPLGLTIEYSVDGGSTWTSENSSTITISAPTAETKVCLRGDNEAYGKPSGESTTITFDKDCYVYGNVMSLISSTDFATLTTLTSSSTFRNLFWKNEHFVSHNTKDLVLPATTLTNGCYYSMFHQSTISRAPELPATVITSSCYSHMFSYCKNLTAAPELPALVLEDECYYAMFEGCTSLTQASALPAMELAWECYDNMYRETAITEAPALPATTLVYSCYYGMFWDCASLVTAPVLPATTLAKDCYEYMFYMCTSLVNAPELPATTLQEGCYVCMFYGCTSLETAPELPAPVLVPSCYSYMFCNCSNLNYVKCLATDLSANDTPNDWQRATNQWLDGVAATGTFVKAEGMNDWTIGTGGIPEGWTISEATGIRALLNDNGEMINDKWYTLDGRLVEHPAKGVYIVNGRKIHVR